MLINRRTQFKNLNIFLVDNEDKVPIQSLIDQMKSYETYDLAYFNLGSLNWTSITLVSHNGAVTFTYLFYGTHFILKKDCNGQKKLKR